MQGGALSSWGGGVGWMEMEEALCLVVASAGLVVPGLGFCGRFVVVVVEEEDLEEVCCRCARVGLALDA
jgi:hypothetical protein